MIFLKKHIGDILIFLGVFAVFFLTGAPQKTLNNSTISIEEIVSEKNRASLEKPLLSPLAPIAPTNSIGSPPNLDLGSQTPPAVNNIPSPDSPPTNPYAVLMNRGNQNQGSENPSIQNSLKNLRGEAPSTEALIERNTYFKKLSEQLKDLQGNVNTDEEKPKDAGKNIAPPSGIDQDAQGDEFDELTEPELDEDLALPGSQ